jgi:DMSO/TMAO reductase YedYZ molybdopterin-dependent catalytic subunit
MKVKVIKSSVAGKERVPPGQRVTRRWPVLHYGETPEIDVSRWTLTVRGLVDKELRLSYEELSALPRVRVLSDIHCVTGWTRLDNLWEGVSTRTIGDMAGVREEARHVLVHSAGGYTTNLTAEDFFQEDVLFALKHDGRELTPEHGYPVRLVVPRLYFWKSAKWVTMVEFTEEEQPGFWESRGCHRRGDPWRQQRYCDDEQAE